MSDPWSRFILLDVRVDDARDVVFFLFDLLEQIVVFLFVVFDLFLEFLGLGGFIGRRSFGLFAFGLGVGCGYRLLDNRSFGFRILALDDGLFLELLALSLFDFLVFGFGFRHFDFRRRFGDARAALFQKRLGLEGEGAFRTFDGPLLQVIEANRAARADAFGSEIRLVQDGFSYQWTKGRSVCHEV